MRSLTRTTRSRLRCWRLRFIVLAAALVGTSAAWLGNSRGKAPTLPELIRTGKLTAQLDDVPSHNRRYRASLLPSPVATSAHVGEWQLRLESIDGEPVSGATIAMQSWMPEQRSVGGYRPLVIPTGKGAYRVEGLRMDRSGWWNVKLTATRSGITDSLAFNLIIP